MEQHKGFPFRFRIYLFPQMHKGWFWTFLPVTRNEDVDAAFADVNNTIADAARYGNWDSLFQKLLEQQEAFLLVVGGAQL